MTTRTEDSLLLLSGGADSAAAAALLQPAMCLFVDYGQNPARSESRAAKAVADELGIPLRSVTIDLSELGSGMLVSGSSLHVAPTEEWFPYRNLYLATMGASFALQLGLQRVLLGLVAEDGNRNVDGSRAFLESLSSLISMQEGGISVHAPLSNETAATVVKECGLSRATLQRTHSCHEKGSCSQQGMLRGFSV